MAKNWRNSRFVAKIFDEICTFWQSKNGILAAKSFGDYQ